MTVEELMRALSALPDKSAPVWIEGCDCANPARGLTTTPDGHAYIEANL